MEDFDGIFRVNRMLSVARSIGDKHMKEFIICKQDFYEFSLIKYQYIIMGCDGLFDEYSSEEVNDML